MRTKVWLWAFALLAAFTLRGGGQERLSAKEKARWQQAVKETAFVEIMGRAGDDTLQVTSRAPMLPKGRAFHLVSYASPDFSFASVPTYVNVETGEYRASGKTHWEGKAAVWSLTIRSNEAQTPMLPSCRFYLSILLWRERRLVFERGKPHKLAEMETAQIPVIAPPPITEEPLK